MNAPLRIGRTPMIRISLPYIYNLATQIEPLETLPQQPTRFGDVFVRLVWLTLR